ncbi:MAG: FliA/WhiG family RNA polymerase sigma factor [Clostridiaceae bacterium]
MTLTNTDELKRKIVEEYTPLVKYIASRIINGKTKHFEYEDLVSYGFIGLLDALAKFDESRGMKFSTYATYRIRGSILDEIRKNSFISKNAMDKLTSYNKALDFLTNKLGRDPDDEEISKYLEISLKDLYEIEGYIQSCSMVSLENLLFGENDDISYIATFEDTKSPNPQNKLEDEEQLILLKKALDNLNEKDKTVISLYYYEEMTLKEIGVILNVSESRVCQLHTRAILRLKNEFKKIHYE